MKIFLRKAEGWQHLIDDGMTLHGQVFSQNMT